MCSLTKCLNAVVQIFIHCGTKQNSWSGLGHSSDFVSFLVFVLQNLASVVSFTVSVCHTYPC